MTTGSDRWLDREAGPVVRPYALTKGRTRPQGTALGLSDMVKVAGPMVREERGLGPEHRRLLGLCQSAIAVADLASETDLPLGVVRVLLADLRERGLDTTQPTLLVLDGSKALHAAGRRLWGQNAVIQRCQVHKKRNVKAHVPEKHLPELDQRLGAVFQTVRLRGCQAVLGSQGQAA